MLSAVNLKVFKGFAVDVFAQAWKYAMEPRNLTKLGDALTRHLSLTATAMFIGMLLCIPLGILTSRSRLAAAIGINAVNVLRVIPSLAILFLFIAIPGFGISQRSASVALTILAMPPILINTDAAFRTIDPAVREAARGMGMAPAQILRRIEIPLALPVVLNGIRTALVEVIASATLAAFVGGGGLGTFITLGFSLSRTDILLVGAVPVALLALSAELALSGLSRLARYPR